MSLNGNRSDSTNPIARILPSWSRTRLGDLLNTKERKLAASKIYPCSFSAIWSNVSILQRGLLQASFVYLLSITSDVAVHSRSQRNSYSIARSFCLAVGCAVALQRRGSDVYRGTAKLNNEEYGRAVYCISQLGACSLLCASSASYYP